MSAARITHVRGNEIGKLSPAKAEAPCAFKTATQASNWNVFNAAKNLEPYLPNVDLVVSMAFKRTRAPMRPTKKSKMPPKMCPSTSGSQSESLAAAAPISIPASISETEMATPNQIIPLEKSPVRFSMLSLLLWNSKGGTKIEKGRNELKVESDTTFLCDGIEISYRVPRGLKTSLKNTDL